jgi:hypothetical protein|tara:strand:- start:1281 stop:1436 length:156 start_codon:yes stop_codon:yes gene_type:complete
MFFNLYLDLAYKYSDELDREGNLISDGGKAVQCGGIFLSLGTINWRYIGWN